MISQMWWNKIGVTATDEIDHEAVRRENENEYEF